jgi:hypothetical protein
VSEKGQERNHPHSAFVLLRVFSRFVLKHRARDAVTACADDDRDLIKAGKSK